MEKTKSKEIFLTRTESVRQIEITLRELFSAAAQLGNHSALTVTGKAMSQSMDARCLKCGAELSGSELFLLAESPRTEQANTIRRLRQNRCAREGCEFNLYKITFQCHAEVDWARLFSMVETTKIQTQPANTESIGEEDAPASPLALLPPPRIILRAGLFAGIIISLFIAHQIYRGGTIPFLRQPEKFHVYTVPAGEALRPAK